MPVLMFHIKSDLGWSIATHCISFHNNHLRQTWVLLLFRFAPIQNPQFQEKGLMNLTKHGGRDGKSIGGNNFRLFQTASH